MLFTSAYFSLFVQFVVGIINLYGLNIDVPKDKMIFSDILKIEFFVQTIEFIFYVWMTINFEIIKSFYEDEYSKGIVDWEADEHHSEFAKWLESSYKYITIERSALEKQMNAAYPESNFDDMFGEPKTDQYGNVTRTMKSCEERYGKTYEEIYGEVNRLEALIDKMDTEVLTELIKRRSYFWT
jgi:hypothetical protein